MAYVPFADRVSRLRPTAVNRVLQEVRQAPGRGALARLADARTARHADAAAYRRGGAEGPARRPHRLSRQPGRARPAPGRRREARARAGALVRSGPRDPHHRRGDAAASVRRWAPWSSRATSVLLPDPIYDAYASPIALWGGSPAPVRATLRDGRFTLEQRGSSRTHGSTGTDVILLNTPWNPVGTVLTREELVDIMGFAEKHDLPGHQRRDLRVADLRRPPARLAGRRSPPTPASGRSWSTASRRLMR